MSCNVIHRINQTHIISHFFIKFQSEIQYLTIKHFMSRSWCHVSKRWHFVTICL